MYRRTVFLVVSTVALLLLVFVNAGRANADLPSCDPLKQTSCWMVQRYLQMVSQDGFNGTPQDLLQVGYTICRNLDSGSSIRDEAQRVQRSVAGATWDQSTHLVAAAGIFLCPGPKH
jgi:hypothetical protein